MASYYYSMSLPCLNTTKSQPFLHKLFIGRNSRKHSSKSANLIKSSLEPNNSMASHPSEDVIQRPTTVAKQFHASPWDGHFLSSSSTTNLHKPAGALGEKRHKELKCKVKSILTSASNNHPFEELVLIDKLQQLGVAYHFEKELDDMLQKIYNEETHHDHADLYFVSLHFRLLRQAGYYVSPDVFNKFKDKKGEFYAHLASDIEGMLSLYEASYLGINGEDIMDEAMAFTTKHLTIMSTCLSSPLASQVRRALRVPLQRSIERIQTRHHISVYQEDKYRNETLLEFAKLDFNILQSLHRHEITKISSWWNDVNIVSKLPFEVRNRVVEGYIFMLTTYFEPQYSLGRFHLGKVFAMLSVLDDTYDVYGNLEELGPLSDAFQRWDAANVNELPDHIKLIFLETLNVFNDIERDVIKMGHFNGMPYLKQEIQIYTKGLLEEARNLYSGDVLTLEEWFSTSLVTNALNIFIVVAVMFMQGLGTQEVFDWIASIPKIIKSNYLLCRILDDVATYKVEEARGIILSAVTCYMKDHGVSKLEAIKSLRKMVQISWEDLNQECLMPNLVPMRVLKSTKYARVLVEFYADGDGYTNSNGCTKEIIASLLTDPIPI